MAPLWRSGAIATNRTVKSWSVEKSQFERLHEQITEQENEMQDLLSKLPPPLCSRVLYSLPEVMTVTGLSRAGAFREFQNGTMKRVLINKSVRVERAELNSWLNCKPFEVTGDHVTADERLNDAVNAMESA